jgi:hypothetical protein
MSASSSEAAEISSTLRPLLTCSVVFHWNTSQFTRLGCEGHREVLGVVEPLPVPLGGEAPQPSRDITEVHGRTLPRLVCCRVRAAGGACVDRIVAADRTEGACGEWTPLDPILRDA